MARELRVVIAGDTSRLSGAFNKAGASTDSFGRKVAGIAGGAMKALGVASLGAGVAVGIGMKKSLDAAGDFQSKMKVLGVVTTHTNGQMAEASKLAIKLGADARLPAVSAADAADAMLQLGKAGFSVGQAMKAARGTLLLATAAETDGATAAKTVTQNIKAFGLQARDTNKVVDEMAGFMNATGTTFTAFADSLSYVGAISKTVGQSFGDTTTQLTILSQAGIEGSMAGTGLRTILSDLGNQSSKASKMLGALGVSTVGANGQFVGMHSVIEQLRPALDKMTSSQKVAFMQAAFGKYAMNAANIVLGISVKKYDELRAAVERKGQADKLAAAHMQGYKGAVAQLGSALETLQISMGLKLLPVATRVANFLTKLASAKDINVGIKIALSGLKTVAGDVKKIVSDALFGTSHTLVIGGEGRATRVTMSQGIIAQLRAYDWGKLLTGSSKTITIGGEGRASRVEVSGGLLGSISTAFQGAMAKVDWKAVGITAGAAIGASITITAAGFDKFAQVAMAWANSHAGQMGAIGATIGLNVISKLLDPGFWAQHWQLIAGIVISVIPVGKFAGIGEKIGAAAVRTFGPTIERLVLAGLEKLPSMLQGPGLKLAIAVGEMLQRAAIAGGREAATLGKKVVDAIASRFGFLGPVVRVLLNTAIVSGIAGLIGSAVSKAEQLATAVAKAIKTAPAKLAGLAGDLMVKLGSAISQAASQAYTAAIAIGEGIGKGAIHGIEGIAGSVASSAAGLGKKAVGALAGAVGFNSPAKEVIPIGEGVGEGLIMGMGHMLVATQTSSQKLGRSLVESIASGLRNSTPSLRTQLLEGIRSAIASAKSDAMTRAADLGSTIGNSISAKASAAVSALDNSPLGQQLAGLNQQIAARQNAEQEAGLRQSLWQAQAGTNGVVDPAAVQAAQQALDDWTLQQQANALGAQLQQQKDAIQAEADARSTATQNGITDLQDQLNRGLISQKDYDAQLQTLLLASGENYYTIGLSLGTATANGFRDGLNALASDDATIGAGASAIAYAKKITSVGSVIGSVGGGKKGVHGFASGGIVKGGRGGVLGLIGEGKRDELITPLDSGAARARLGGGGGDTYNVTVNALKADRDVGNVVIEAIVAAKRGGNTNLKLGL